MTQVEDLSALSRLLGQWFEAEELRRFAGQHHDVGDLEAELPGRAAPAAEVVHAIVVGLDRRGLIDADFFDRLRAARPRKIAEIDQLCAGLALRSRGERPRGSFVRMGLVVVTALLLLLLSWQWLLAGHPRFGDPPEQFVAPRPAGAGSAEVVAPAAVLPVVTREPETRETVVKIASDNEIVAPGGQVSIVGVQEGR